MRKVRHKMGLPPLTYFSPSSSSSPLLLLLLLLILFTHPGRGEGGWVAPSSSSTHAPVIAHHHPPPQLPPPPQPQLPPPPPPPGSFNQPTTQHPLSHLSSIFLKLRSQNFNAITMEEPRALPLTQDKSRDLLLNQDKPHALPLSQDSPSTHDPRDIRDQPHVLPLTQYPQPLALSLTQDQPIALPLTQQSQDPPIALPLTQDIQGPPIALPLSQELQDAPLAHSLTQEIQNQPIALPYTQYALPTLPLAPQDRPIALPFTQDFQDQLVALPLPQDKTQALPLTPQDQPMALPLTDHEDTPCALPLTEDQDPSRTLPLSQGPSRVMHITDQQDLPHALPLTDNQDTPRALSLKQEPPRSLPLDQEPPLALPLNQEPPLAMPLNQEPPLALPLNQEPPQTLPLNQEPPRALPLSPHQDPQRDTLTFTQEPAHLLHFTNTSGAVVDCVAEGSPTPTVTWTHADGRPIEQVPGLLRLARNGSLVFPPFPSHRYDTRLHSATYLCRASSRAGTLLATPTIVRAVVVGQYRVQVYDQLVMAGNTAVLRCVVPPYLREFVTVTSWLLDDTLHLYPSLHGDGKYHVTESGELHVLEVTQADGHSRFRCRALHHLTGHSHLSSTPARIIVTEPQGAAAPQMSERGGRVVVSGGAPVTLPCVAHGHPPPSYTWYRGSEAVGGEGAGVWVVGGSLVVGGAGQTDTGHYTCIANNTAGQARMSLHLLVTLPLSVQVRPREVEVEAGSQLELRCHITGSLVEGVKWYRDGGEVRAEGRVTIRPREVLRVAPLSTSDSGLYQCAASTQDGHYAHDHARVVVAQGAAPPELLYRFIEQTLQPGPAVSLKCIATGTPTPHITWALDGFPLPHSHRLVKGQYVSAQGDVISHVNISAVHVADGGTYTCTAENHAGTATHSARLNVYGPPQVRPMGQMAAVAGKTFTVTCPAAGHPIHAITWSKDGSQLPRSHRQRVLTNGTLVVEQVTQGVDDGSYSCTASSRGGRSDSQTLQLRVLVPPRMAPLHFPGGTRAGMQIRATCLVQEGDQPVKYAWTKDGRPLDARLGVRTSQLDAFTSILVIEQAAATHSGNYTCTASNAAATAATTDRLTVRVPPTWVVEPSSASVALGGSLALPCLARGFPDPITTWRRQTASGEFVDVGDGGVGIEGGLAQWQNGTLWVGRAARGHEGRYLCEANNGVPPGLSQLVNLTVNEPPWFRSVKQRQEVRVGASATLTCHAYGDAPLTLTWTRDATPLPPQSRFRVSRGTGSDERGSGGRVTQLVVAEARLDDSGTFVCTATNPHGSRTAHHHLLVQDVPGPPSGVRVEEEGPRHLTLSWTPPEDSNAPITAYIVTLEPQPGPNSGAGREERVGSGERRARLGKLHPATHYRVTVAAENRVGRGRSSPTVSASTQEEPPSAPPRDVTVVGVSPRALQVSWEPPPHNSTNGLLLGYHLGYKILGGDEDAAYNFSQVVGVEGVGLASARVSGLRPHSRYSIVLRAFNSKGAGPSSPPALATTLQDKPSAPPGQVRCSSQTSSSLVVSWAPPPPTHRNGVITSYRVAYWRTDSPEDKMGGTGVVTEGQQASLKGLQPWTNYSVTVAASTGAGQGVTSTPLTCTTQQDVPEAPAKVKVVVSGPRAAVVSWVPPRRPNGRITRYTVHWRTGGGTTTHTRHVDPQMSHLALHDLSHTTHQVWVTAATSVGEGPASDTVLVKPSHVVAAGVWSLGRNVTAAWGEDVSLACGTVGVPEPDLSWTHRGAPLPTSRSRAVVQQDGTLSLSDLQRNDGGYYTCTATNRHGHDAAVYLLTVLVPPSPPSLHVTETTSSSIRVQWSVRDTGGAALLGATLHYRPVGGQWVKSVVDGDDRTFTAQNLRCGSLHHFYVTVYNYVGRSEPSRTEVARTKGRPPQAPPQFQFVTSNSSQATLYLSQWTDGGCPITHFSVEYRRGPTDSWTTVSSEVLPARTYTISGLDAGTNYQLQVTAHNSAGATPAHYTITTPLYGHPVDLSEGGGMWGETATPPSAWQDPRVLVPAAVSGLALLLTLTTVCVCLRRRVPSRPPQKMSQDGKDGECEKGVVQEELYTTVRRPAPTPPRHHHHPSADSTGDYSSEELYHYAAASYQLEGGSPPPPAPPSPPNHVLPQSRPQKAFTALIYQAPSLHDVDSPNTSEGEGRNSRPLPPNGAPGDSQGSEGYGSLMEPAPPPSALHHHHHHRPPRNPRLARIPHNVHFP